MAPSDPPSAAVTVDTIRPKFQTLGRVFRRCHCDVVQAELDWVTDDAARTHAAEEQLRRSWQGVRECVGRCAESVVVVPLLWTIHHGGRGPATTRLHMTALLVDATDRRTVWFYDPAARIAVGNEGCLGEVDVLLRTVDCGPMPRLLATHARSRGSGTAYGTVAVVLLYALLVCRFAAVHPGELAQHLGHTLAMCDSEPFHSTGAVLDGLQAWYDAMPTKVDREVCGYLGILLPKHRTQGRLCGAFLSSANVQCTLPVHNEGYVFCQDHLSELLRSGVAPVHRSSH